MTSSDVLQMALLRQSKIIESIEEDQKRGLDGYINIMRNASLRGSLGCEMLESECDFATREPAVPSRVDAATPIRSSVRNHEAMQDVTAQCRTNRLEDNDGASSSGQARRRSISQSAEGEAGNEFDDTSSKSAYSSLQGRITNGKAVNTQLFAKQILENVRKRARSVCEQTRDQAELRTRTILFLPHDFDPPQGCVFGPTWLPSHMILNYTHEQSQVDPASIVRDRYTIQDMYKEPVKFCHIFVPAQKMHKAYKRQMVEKFILENPGLEDQSCLTQAES